MKPKVQSAGSVLPSIVIEPTAQDLGLLPGLTVGRSTIPYLCACCGELSVRDEVVWVPDHIQIGGRPEEIAEICRLSLYENNHSGWCVPCALRLGEPQPTPKGGWDQIDGLVIGGALAGFVLAVLFVVLVL